jgi:hypothetical protein
MREYAAEKAKQTNSGTGKRLAMPQKDKARYGENQTRSRTGK